MISRPLFRRCDLRIVLLAAIATLVAPLGRTQDPIANDVQTYRIDLPTVLRLAKANNLDIRLAQERIAEAKASHSAAIAKFLPWLGVGISYRAHDGRIQAVDGTLLDVDKQSTSIGPTISAQVDLGDALFTTLATRQHVAAANAALSAQEQDSTLAAAGGYFTLLQAKALVETNRAALATSQSYEQQLEGGVNAGVIFKGDLLRVQTQTQRYQAAVIQAQQQQRVASSRLVELLHLDPLVELLPEDNELLPMDLADVGVTRDDASPPDLVSQALNNRAELRQSQAQLRAAHEVETNAKYGPLIPTLSAQASFGQFGGGRDGAGGNFGAANDYLIGLSWRIGPGGLLDVSRIRAATSKLRSAELGLEKTSSAIQRQVVEAQARVRSLAEQLTVNQDSLSNAAETLRLTRERKQLGVGLVLEDIQAQQELVRARTEYLNAIAEYNKAQFELSKALGNL